MRKIKFDLVSAVLVIVAIAVVLIGKLFSSPEVTVNGIEVFSWANIKYTGIITLVAVIIVVLIKMAKNGNRDNDENG